MTEHIYISEVGLGGWSQEDALNWRLLAKFQNPANKENTTWLESELASLHRFIKAPATERGDEERTYRPDTVDLSHGPLWASADRQLGISTRHSEPIAVIEASPRNVYLFETDNPKIFCVFEVLWESLRKKQHVSLEQSTLMKLEKYTDEERENMIENLNSPRMRQMRLK